VADLQFAEKRHQRLSVHLARFRLRKSLHNPKQQDLDDATPRRNCLLKAAMEFQATYPRICEGTCANGKGWFQRMTVIPINLKAIVKARSEANDQLRLRGDTVLVERDTPRWLIMLCPCGCNEVIPVNLDERSGPAWEYYGGTNGLSVFPSVWRDTGCKSHFIIWYGRILLFDGVGEDRPIIPESVLEPLIGKVRGMLSSKPTHFRDIARTLGAVPWDVHYVCRQLVNTGYAQEGSNERKGFFKLATGI
jgi:hypothetical protein